MVCAKSLSDVNNELIKWLWKPYIPFGKVTLIQGNTGIGKTSIVIKITADLSRGIYPPTMLHKRLIPSVQAEPIKSYYVTIENGISDTVAPLFDLYGGNRMNMFFQDESKGHFELTGEEIEQCVAQTGAKLIVIDPWQQFIPHLSTSDNKAIRSMICDIQKGAEASGAAVVLSGNFTKSPGSDISRGIGASELNNTLRSILTIREPSSGDPTTRLLTVTKMSLPEKETTPVVIQQDSRGNLFYADYYVDDNVYDTNFEDSPPETHSQTSNPVDFLRVILKDGPLNRNTVMKAGETYGFSKQQLYNNRKKAGVDYKKQSDKSSLWMLRDNN